jgi:hypothetical protein
MEKVTPRSVTYSILENVVPDQKVMLKTPVVDWKTSFPWFIAKKSQANHSHHINLLHQSPVRPDWKQLGPDTDRSNNR